jgi:two-component system CAI-1 autoinducer sensor kinase/phosphatase CqsS
MTISCCGPWTRRSVLCCSSRTGGRPRLKRYYFAYSYLVLIVTLPMTFVFTSLKHGGGTIAVGNTLLAVFLVILLSDWRNTIVILLSGFGLATLLYVGTDVDPQMPVDYVQRLPILLAVVLGGSLFKSALERSTAEKVRNAYASLAGSIAHEMRNPLGQLKHSLESMQQALPAPTTRTQTHALSSDAVDQLYRHVAQGQLAVRRGLQVISMTLDEVNAKPLDPSGFVYLSAAEVCGAAVQEYGYESDEQRARVSVQVVQDFVFRGDETAYLFVLFNLIKNALFYLTLYPHALVTVTVDRNTVTVHDSGPGIARDDMGQLFKPFGTMGKTGGTGLGLAYCRRVMRAFGGDISCESVQGEYTVFTMQFPAVADHETEAHRMAVLGRAHSAFNGRRLLIVDDDAALRMTTRHKLQPLGAVIEEAADGQRALELLARARYDLIVLDLNMPVIDGYALAEKIRRGDVPDNRDVCIVAYTSEPTHLAGVKTQKAGMDGLVNKPCAQLPLVQTLYHALMYPVARIRPEAAMLSGRRILLADDNPSNRKAVAAYLKHAGVQVVEAGHGQAVLDQLGTSGVWDAVLMDINMPGMDGLQTTQAIRQSAMACRGVPILALTAQSDAATVAAAQAAGMNDFLTKPVEADVLYAKLREQMGLRAAPPVAPAPAAPISAGAGVSRVLDEDRLRGYQRLGMLDELLGDYLPDIARLVQRLGKGAAAQDLQATMEALHSLVGMAGEAGALALHQEARRTYLWMIEGRRWPQEEGWLARIESLAAAADQALREYGAGQLQKGQNQH